MEKHKKDPVRFTFWYRALRMEERLERLRRAAIGANIDPQLAEEQLGRWQEESPFSDPCAFDAYLTAFDLDLREFSAVLAIQATATASGEPAPPWVQVLNTAWDCSGGTQWDRLLCPPSRQLLRPFLPLLHHGRRRLREGVRNLLPTWKPPFCPIAVSDLLLDTLPGQLLSISERTLVLEMHIARLSGELVSASPEDRFTEFVNLAGQQDRRLALFAEYPVLARQMVGAITRWAEVGLDFLRHLSEDWHDLCTTFAAGADPGALRQVTGNLAERHCGGRSPLIAQFDCGLQVVYKPRSLAVDLHFQELLQWCNQRSTSLSFRTLAVLDRRDHGWVEYVGAKACLNPEQVRQFYRRQGAYLALLYALEATDIHCDNLIAAGEHPILVDLESMFHPRLPDRVGRDNSLGDLLRTSVLRVGLLPQPIGERAGTVGIDLSGLGGQPGQLSPLGVLLWESTATDGMRLVRNAVHWSGSDNRPSLNGVAAGPQEYVEAIVAGFCGMYRQLVTYREELLTKSGPLARFAEDEVRAILRPSPFYAGLLAESFHPNLLRDGLERERFFSKLWIGTKQRPWLGRVCMAETADLHEADLPHFTARPGRRDLWDSRGRRIKQFFDRTSLSAVRARLLSLNERDLVGQVWFVRATLATLSVPGGEVAPMPPPVLADAVERERLLELACGIGERLESLALPCGESTAWVGLTLDGRAGRWALGALGTDLYGGLPGLTLFFGYLGAVAGQERYTRLAATTLVALEAAIARDHIEAIGAFWGWGGLLYTYSHLATLWNRPDLIEKAMGIVEVATRKIPVDRRFDLIGGAAGCIGGLLSLYRCAPHPRILSVARSCAEHLCTHARQTEAGLGWISSVSARPLAGFAHGGAGIAWALLQLFSVDGDDRWRTAAALAIDHERSLFETAKGNWTDLRDHPGRWADPVAWCHGAVGIGLARLDTLSCFDNDFVREDIAAALKVTLQRGWTDGHCLCHGRLGNLELLASARDRIGEPGLGAQVSSWLAATVLEGVSKGWKCGLPGGAESPGLMHGLAGIGYGLLRLAAPDAVPSVLVLAAPPEQVRLRAEKGN